MKKSKAKRARPAVPIVPPRGPATNLRPAGPHGDARRTTRAVAAREALAESD